MKFFANPKKEFKKWLSTATIRRHSEDDLLSDKQRTALAELLADAASGDPAELKKFQDRYEKILPRYRHAGIRELLDLIVVVGAVAFGIRALYFQPFRIPTSSMQPTLYGIHYQTKDGNANCGYNVLSGVLHQIVYGTAPAAAEVKSPGVFTGFSQIEPGTVFDRMRFFIGNTELCQAECGREYSEG